MKEHLLNKIEGGDFLYKQMMINQLYSWELFLRKRELKEATIDRKLRNAIYFYVHMTNLRKNKIKATKDNLSKIAFEFVRDGYFSNENIDNEGSATYRRSIYSDIREAFNFIYEGHFKETNDVIKELTDEEKELLDDISKNKFFKIVVKQNNDNYYDIQSKLIEDLGIKVYFDENGKAYILSHELAELIGKSNKDVMKSLRTILDRLQERKFSPLYQSLDFTMVEDNYTYSINNGGSKKVVTYRIYKDLLINYILGLTGDKYFDFKVNYQSAFNYIEEEFNKQLKLNSQLKEDFLRMYNDIRKTNRELLINKVNKDLKKKKKGA